MTDFAVTVHFEVAEDDRATFLDLAEAQAHASLAEDGCSAFEIWTAPNRPTEVFFWETYTSKAAFDFHLTTDHFHDFNARSRPLTRKKTVRTWVIEEG